MDVSLEERCPMMLSNIRESKLPLNDIRLSPIYLLHGMQTERSMADLFASYAIEIAVALQYLYTDICDELDIASMNGMEMMNTAYQLLVNEVIEEGE